MQRLAVNSLWGMGTYSCGFLSGDLWEQESGINGFAERFAVGTVLGCQRKAPGGFRMAALLPSLQASSCLGSSRQSA